MTRPTRRTFVGWLVAAPTLVAVADLAAPEAAALPTPPQPPAVFDLNDAMTLAAAPTSGRIRVVVTEEGTAELALPRAEVGQGITTSTAMLIAEELRLDIGRVRVTLADARPELVFNQLTGGSNTTFSTYTPIRVAAATALAGLRTAAARRWGVPADRITAADGVLTAPDGRRAGYGELAREAAVTTPSPLAVTLRDDDELEVVGRPHGRIDALEAVTGRKRFAMDLDVPGALPTMLARPPRIGSRLLSVANLEQVRAMPGVTHAVALPGGVAVRARTFGQCIDAVRAVQATWTPGPLAGVSDEDVRARLQRAELPVLAPPLPILTTVVDARFTFWFKSNSALETNSAVADVRSDRAEVWGSFKTPISAQRTIARELGLPTEKVTVHVVQGGGSFGRRLFFDAALEAAQASRAMGVPVRLMWHRTDDSRQGRVHPMAISRVRAVMLGGDVLRFDQRHTGISTDLSHGFGDALAATAEHSGTGGMASAQAFFTLSQQTGYDLGATSQLLREVEAGFHTGSMRNVYSPDVRVATELVVDRLAQQARLDPVAFRVGRIREGRGREVVRRAAAEGRWGRALPAGVAQGLAYHPEYHSHCAVLVEVDARPETVDRHVERGVTGPRVTSVVVVVDVGLVVNPRGLEAQMQGGVNDGIAMVLTSSLHLRDGAFLEGSWDNYFYTRQWNTPLSVKVVLMPSTGRRPGGAGELAVAPTAAAVACAYARATGTLPTEFPINHGRLSFTPMPTVPSIPASPAGRPVDTV